MESPHKDSKPDMCVCVCVCVWERESERDRREETVKEIVYPQKSKDLSSFSNTQFVPNLYDYFLPWSTKGEILKTSFKKDTKAGSSKWMWIIKVVNLNWELNYIKCYIKKSIWHVIEQTEISVVRDSPHKNENCLHLLTLESFQTWIHFFLRLVTKEFRVLFTFVVIFVYTVEVKKVRFGMTWRVGYPMDYPFKVHSHNNSENFACKKGLLYISIV